MGTIGLFQIYSVVLTWWFMSIYINVILKIEYNFKILLTTTDNKEFSFRHK